MTEILGIIGATIILFAFGMNQTQRWSNTTPAYDYTNFIGSLLLVIYAYLTGSIPFFVLNLVWALFSLKDIVRKS